MNLNLLKEKEGGFQKQRYFTLIFPLVASLLFWKLRVTSLSSSNFCFRVSTKQAAHHSATVTERESQDSSSPSTLTGKFVFKLWQNSQGPVESSN